MKNLMFLAYALCATIVIVTAVPLPTPEQTNELEVLQIPLENHKELDILSLAEDDGQISERNKRTIGILRDLFPELSKIVEQKIQMLIPIVLRAVGPILLQSGGLGGGGGGANGGNNKSPSFDDDDDNDNNNNDDDDDNDSGLVNGRKVSISLPTFPPDNDDDDDDDDDDDSSSSNSNESKTTTVASAADQATHESHIQSHILPLTTTTVGTVKGAESAKIIVTEAVTSVTYLPPITTEAAATTTTTTTTTSTTTTTTTPATPTATTENDKKNENSNNIDSVSVNGDNSIDMELLSQKLESINRVVRNAAGGSTQTDGSVAASAAAAAAAALAADSSNAIDSNSADVQQKSEQKAPAIDELSLDTEDTEDNRNKRFLSFGFGGSSGGGAGGSAAGGGSGNFLFDIIRLVSGSSGTEQSDEKENAPDGGDGGDAPKTASDGYQEAIPGPVTRLFVLANRGISNLVQDLILRLAATSERVVNFKARLITSLI